MLYFNDTCSLKVVCDFTSGLWSDFDPLKFADNISFLWVYFLPHYKIYIVILTSAFLMVTTVTMAFSKMHKVVTMLYQSKLLQALT